MLILKCLKAGNSCTRYRKKGRPTCGPPQLSIWDLLVLAFRVNCKGLPPFPIVILDIQPSRYPVTHVPSWRVNSTHLSPSNTGVHFKDNMTWKHIPNIKFQQQSANVTMWQCDNVRCQVRIIESKCHDTIRCHVEALRCHKAIIMLNEKID